MADPIEETMQIGKKTKKEKKTRKEKRQNGNEEKKRKGKTRGRGKEKERRRGQNIFKNYRVTMKVQNHKVKSTVRKM